MKFLTIDYQNGVSQIIDCESHIDLIKYFMDQEEDRDYLAISICKDNFNIDVYRLDDVNEIKV